MMSFARQSLRPAALGDDVREVVVAGVGGVGSAYKKRAERGGGRGGLDGRGWGEGRCEARRTVCDGMRR